MLTMAGVNWTLLVPGTCLVWSLLIPFILRGKGRPLLGRDGQGGLSREVPPEVSQYVGSRQPQKRPRGGQLRQKRGPLWRPWSAHSQVVLARTVEMGRSKRYIQSESEKALCCASETCLALGRQWRERCAGKRLYEKLMAGVVVRPKGSPALKAGQRRCEAVCIDEPRVRMEAVLWPPSLRDGQLLVSLTVAPPDTLPSRRPQPWLLFARFFSPVPAGSPPWCAGPMSVPTCVHPVHVAA